MSHANQTLDPGYANQHRTHLVRRVAFFVGLAFLAIGTMGFIPYFTSGYNGMTFASHHSTAMLFGIFHVSVLHNSVHLLFGLAGIVMAVTQSTAVLYLLASGAIYALLTIYGFLVPDDSAANFVPLNMADNLLHLGLAIVLLALGLVLRQRPSEQGED